MSHENQIYGQIAAQAGPQCASAPREVKALEHLGAKLAMSAKRMNNTIDRVNSLAARVFGVVEEIQAGALSDGNGLERKLSKEVEPPGTLPSLSRLADGIEVQVNRLNKALDKLETLA
jgi:hypothetical protein